MRAKTDLFKIGVSTGTHAQVLSGLLLATMVSYAVTFNTPAARAEANCKPTDFARVMDDTGARLNELAVTNSSKIRTLSSKLAFAGKGAAGKGEARSSGHNNVPLSPAAQAKVSGYNAQIDELINRMDRLGDLTLDASTDCRRLMDLKTTSASLLEIQKRRFALINQDLSRQLLPPKPKPTVAAKSTAKSKLTAKTKTKAKTKATTKPKWKTTTAIAPSPTPNGQAPQPLLPGTPPAPALPILPALPEPSEVEETFSIAEIKAAGRGFFGTISTNLANVINYTFQKVGRPTGYILGREAGGAFIAGLRYGKGRLVMKRFDKRQKVYWRGPSLGYDAGAEGSRTMFLIYNLHEPKKLFRRFTGADGAAYFVGGIGITFLTNGKVVLAPIRSGIGIRLGASIGYLKFSAKPGWNPF